MWMNARVARDAFGQTLVGKVVGTVRYGDWPGGDAEVVRLDPDPAAPEIVFEVRLAGGWQIGVFAHEDVRLPEGPEGPGARVETVKKLGARAMGEKAYRAPRGFVRDGAEVYARIPGRNTWAFRTVRVHTVLSTGGVLVEWDEDGHRMSRALPRRNVLCPAGDRTAWARTARAAARARERERVNDADP